MEYFKRDALNQMAQYCRNRNNFTGDTYCALLPIMIDFDDNMINRMFIHIFNSEPKFDNDYVCFGYIENKASALFEMMHTLKENNYCEGSINQIFNNYCFYIGNLMLKEKKTDTIIRILELL